MPRFRLAPWVGLASLLAGPSAPALPIPGLFATGVDSAGALLSASAVDPHWQLASTPTGVPAGPAAFVVNDGYPIPPWLENGPASRWIAPAANQATGNPPGNYIYRLVFDLGAFDVATAVVTGRWSSDNAGVDIRLNGQSTGVTYGGDFTALSTPFTLRQGFIDGANTLDFVVNNAGDAANPTGFRAELAGTADPLPPPGTPPTLRRQPEDVTVSPGEPALFRVEATGAPPLRYQWRLDGSPLAGANSSTFSIASVTADWVGGYEAVVRNEAGAITSRVARLVVRSPSPAERTWEPPGPSTRRTGIAVSELLLHPPPRADARQLAFAEFHNTQPYFEDLSGWRVSGAFDFIFPTNTLLPGGARLVLAASPADLRATTPVPTNALLLGGFPYQPAADGSGSLRVRKRSGAVVLEVAWNAADPACPAAAFGPGHALVLARPSLGERDPHAWAPGARLGGTPGEPEPIPSGPLESVVLEELLAGPSPFVELHNRGLARVDLSGCRLQADALDGSARTASVLPAGTTLPPNGFLALSPPDLQLPSRGGLLLLLDPDQTRVLDAVRYPAQVAGIASGRDPDDRQPWRRLARPTPGEPNAPPAVAPVVLHEILAHPPSGDPSDEFVELHNPGPDPVALGGWRFTEGIRFQFPPEASLAPGGFLVVVPDRLLFLARHPGLEGSRVFGDYAGSLSDAGERLTLSRPEPASGPLLPDTPFVPVDDVAYPDASRWSRWADGGGSSLELVDPRADRRLAPNWADSDETTRAPWTTIEATGVLNLGHPGVPQADQLQVLLLGPGEALLDNVAVLVNGANRVANGTFESGAGGWFFQGTHRLSRAESAEGDGGGRSLRLVASERGDHVANRVRTVLSSAITAGTPVTLRARVRWIRGHPEILLRLRNGTLEASGRLALPPFAGTPGEPNSRRLANAPPAILEVEHRPVLPAAGQSVRVTARVHDPDGLRRVVLRLRTDPATTTEDRPMTDDGTGGDDLAGDGLFTGQIPGRAAGTLVAFRVIATDAAQPPAPDAVFPGEPHPGECLVRFGEAIVPGAFGNYRLWMTRSDHDRWATREKMSNEDVPVTFVLGDFRAIHGAGAHYAGSSYSSPGYTSPTGALCGYDIGFPDGSPLLGDSRITLDWPIRDDTDQREPLMFWFLEQYGLPNLHRRYVHLHVNGVRRGTIYDDVQQPGRDTVSEWFAGDDEGSLWKTDCWNEFDNLGNRVDPCVLNTLQRYPTTGTLKVARYRWNWRPRAVRGSANDFSDLFALVETANQTTAYLPAVESLIDVDHWMRTFAMNDLASYWDAFGNPNAKNTFLYKPRQDRWKLMCWDFDVGLGVFNDPPTAALFDVNDPTLTRMYRTPAFVRRYWAALDEALQGFFRTGPGSPIDAFLDARFAAFRSQNIPLAAPSAIKSWINQRRTFLLTQLATVRAPFAITTRGGASFATNREPVTLAGAAPVGVRFLAINGTLRPVDWTTVTNWSLVLSLLPGTNALHVAGLDARGLPVPGGEDSITITFTGSPSPPPPIRFNEWMAANRTTATDPADDDFDDWFELTNAGSTPVDLTGYSLTDDPANPRRFVIPPGFLLGPGAFLLVWADAEPNQTQPGLTLHTGFRLDRDGSELALFDPLGRIVDSLRFGPQIPDVAEGRWGDGRGDAVFALALATPGAANASPASPTLDLGFAAAFEPASRSLVLTWTATAGRGYAVDVKDQLATDLPWRSFAEIPPAPAGPRTVRDPLPSGAAERYYRIRLLP